jgi:hypothetical protein
MYRYEYVQADDIDVHVKIAVIYESKMNHTPLYACKIMHI